MMLNPEALINLLLILGLIGLAILAVYFLFVQGSVEEENEARFSYDLLKAEAKDMINGYIGADVKGLGLSKKMMRKQEKQRQSVARSVRTCCSGNAGSKIVVKDMISNFLLHKGVNEETIDYIIPFNAPHKMTGWQLFEIMVYMHDKDGEEGCLRLHREESLFKEKKTADGGVCYELNEEDIRQMYKNGRYSLGFRDKLNVLTQLLFADTYGLSVVDTLNYQTGLIEEVQIGLTGLQEFVYDYRKELGDKETGIFYSKDAVHVIISGLNIWFSFLSFGTEDEMQRVIHNLTQDSGAGELTRARPKIIVETVDGRRVTVARPPETDSWCGFIRKFDSVPAKDLDTMYHSKDGAPIVNWIMRNLVRTGCNMAYTGEMSAGKTTLFRLGLKETRPDLSIRTIESGSFELNVRKHIPGRNSLAMRVTDLITEKDVMELVRKTTGQIFCIGEINSLDMANLCMNLSRISQQTLLSAHYPTTEDMVRDFQTAKICIGGFSNERLAEIDAISSLQFDTHIRMGRGERYIQYINEVIPITDLESFYDGEDITEDNAAEKTARGVRDLRRQLANNKMYRVQKIVEYDEEKETYIFHNKPSKRCYDKAKWYMPPEQYKEFEEMFELLETFAKEKSVTVVEDAFLNEVNKGAGREIHNSGFDAGKEGMMDGADDKGCVE